MKSRIAAALAVATLGWAGCQTSPATASTDTPGSNVGVAAALAAPRDVTCDEFLGGTRIYCVHGTDGNVIVALENYAGCRTEDSCTWDYRSNTSGPYAGDGYWMLVGANP